jgi:hypothetical protein
MRKASRRVGLPRRYLVSFAVEVVRQMALMLLAVEALYLSDKMVTHLLFDALRNQLGVGFLVETLVLAAPEILSVGFPIAVVIAVYFALLRRREAGDFVILAGAGVAPRALVGFCLGLGLLALTLAGGLRGFIEPLAARQLATRLIEGRFEAVQQGQLTAGQFLTIGTTTFYQQPRTDGGPESGDAGEDAGEDAGGARTFVFLAPSPDEEQVVTAARSRLNYTMGDEIGSLDLDGARVIAFTRGEGQERTPSVQIGVEHLRVGGVPIALPDAVARGGVTRGAMLPELVIRWLEGETDAGRATLERLLGMALAFVAPLLAGLGLVATRGRMRLGALPAAQGVVLGGGLGVAPAAEFLVGLGPAPAMAIALAATLAVALTVALVMGRLLPGSILPQRMHL